MQMNRIGMAAAVVGILSGIGLLGGCASERGLSGGVLTGDSLEYAQAAFEAKRQKYQTRGPKPKNQPAEAMAFFLEQRLPDGMDTYPIERLEAARAQMQQARAQRRGAAVGDITSWEAIGPGNIGGRTRAMAINPDSPEIMYAGGVAGGVWKSVDAGQFWVPTGDTLPNMAVTDIVFDPRDLSVMYFSTGEGFFNGDAVRGLGIFRSTDAGDTWSQLEATNNGNFFFVNKLAIAEAVIDDEPVVEIYAATDVGVFRSRDDGTTWDLVLTPGGGSVGFTDIAIGDGYVLAASGSFNTDGVYRSDDNGDSWELVLSEPNQGRVTLSIYPGDTDIIYAASSDNRDNGFLNLFRSLDGGLNWEARTNLANNLNQALFSNVLFSPVCFGGDFNQGWYDNVVAVDPADPNIVWVGGIDLFRSDDGGQNFQLASYWYFEPTEVNYNHADHHELVFHPDYNGTTNQTMYSGSDGGIARTDNARDVLTVNNCPFVQTEPLPQLTWVQLNNNYGITQFYHGDTAPSSATAIGGTQDNGTLRTDSTDPASPWIEIQGGDGGYVQINPQNPDVIYAEFTGISITKSVDGGQSFVRATTGINEGGMFINPFAMDQNNPEVLWTGGSNVWRTTNGAGLWENVGNRLAFGAGVSAIGISPTTSDVVYIGYSNGVVVRSDNALDDEPDWSFSSGIPGFVSSLAVDPNDPMTVYATTSFFFVDQVYRSIDGGQNFQSIDGIGLEGIPDIPVHSIAIRPTNSQQLYAGTEVGVFASDDAGATWFPASEGLANTVVEWLDFSDPNTLVAFTHGRSAFRADLTPSVAIDIEPVGGPLPTELPRNVPVTIEATITPISDTLAQTPRLWVRTTNSDNFVSLQMMNTGGDVYSSTIPALECHADPEYFIQVFGENSGEVLFPTGGTVKAEVVENINSFFDDGEVVAGWTVSGDATDGAWERGFPDDNDRADPPSDFDGTGRCWLTDIDPNNANSDIDDGRTILTSPEIEIPRGAVFSFAYWFNAQGGTSPEDSFRVEVSTDNFQTPENTHEIFSSDVPEPAWKEVVLVAGEGEFILNPSGSEWIRVIASDEGDRNIVEAGLDAVDIGRRTCELCLADANRDGVVSPIDFGAWLQAFNRGDPIADVNLDEFLDPTDFGAWLAAFRFGCD